VTFAKHADGKIRVNYGNEDDAKIVPAGGVRGEPGAQGVEGCGALN
jgi:hypothetical protein